MRPEELDDTVEGIVTGNDFRLQGGHVTGWLTVKSDEMSGTVNDMLPVTVMVSRKPDQEGST